MAKILTNEVKTGLLVVACLVILISLTTSVGKFSIFNPTYRLKIMFNWVSGLENDAPVRLSGVDVGKVESVQILYTKEGETKVLLTVLMNAAAKPREDSKAYVTILGLMGEKYIEITSGSKDKPFLKPDSTIIGEDPLQMEEIMDMAKKIAAEIDAALKDIRKLTNHLDEVVVENKTDINETMGNLKRTTKNFEEFSADIKNNPWKLLIKSKEK